MIGIDQITLWTWMVPTTLVAKLKIWTSFEDFGKVWYLVNLTICKFDVSGFAERDISEVYMH
jgi:hypothetical protein